MLIQQIEWKRPKDAFKSDSDIKKALTAYLDNDKDYAEEEEEELEEDNYNQEDDY